MSTITKNEPVWFMSTWAAWPFVEENEATLVEIKSTFPAPTEPHYDSTGEAVLALAAAGND
jgi:hypothetical protein